MNGGQISEALDRFIQRAGVVTAAQCLRDEGESMIDLAKPRCGNCHHWMKKSDCPREARGEKPSTNGLSCPTYLEESRNANFRQRGYEKLKEADALLKTLEPTQPAKED